MKNVIATISIAAYLILASVGVVSAARQHGPPGVTCASTMGLVTLIAPGAAAFGAGSAFNATGRAGNVFAGTPGTALGTNSPSVNAISQYDAACLQVTTQVP